MSTSILYYVSKSSKCNAAGYWHNKLDTDIWCPSLCLKQSILADS